MPLASAIATNARFRACVTEYIDDGNTIEPGRDDEQHVATELAARHWAEAKLTEHMRSLAPWDADAQPTYWAASVELGCWKLHSADGIEFADWERTGESDGAWWDADDRRVRWESEPAKETS
jgi:hypothetical protein